MIVVPEIASELVGLLIWKLLNLMDTKMKLFICTDPLDVRLVVVVVSSNRWKSILHLELWLDQLNKNGNYIYNSKFKKRGNYSSGGHYSRDMLSKEMSNTKAELPQEGILFGTQFPSL